MKKKTAALIALSIALVLALAGGAFAAGHYLITSTKQIKPSVLRDLRGRQGEPGFTGQDGRPGATGATGPAGTNGTSSVITLQIVTATQNICAEATGVTCNVPLATATCPAGSYVTGGSASATTPETTVSTIAGATTYAAIAANITQVTGVLSVSAICASGPSLSEPIASSVDVAARAQALRVRLLR